MPGIYTCGHCGGAVSRSTRRCPHCSVLLAGIRCTGCGFVGGEGDFPGDRCPKCGTRVWTGGGSSAAPQQQKCKGCGKLIKLSDWTCPHCGYTQWGSVVGMGIFSFLCIAGGVWGSSHGGWPRLVGWLAGILGIILLLGTVSETIVGLRARNRRREQG